MGHKEVEQWAVNASVHYNPWANLSVIDFRPVVGAFQALCDLFKCPHCGGLIRVLAEGPNPVSVHCTCGSLHWGLEVRRNIVQVRY